MRFRGVIEGFYGEPWSHAERLDLINCPEDEARYGVAERPSGAAQCEFTNRFREAFPQPGPLVVCPMGYAGTGDSPEPFI